MDGNGQTGCPPLPPVARRRPKITQLDEGTNDNQTSESSTSSSTIGESRRKRASLIIKSESGFRDEEYTKINDFKIVEETPNARVPPIAPDTSESCQESNASSKRRSLRQLQSVDSIRKPEADLRRRKFQTLNFEMGSNHDATKESHVAQFKRITLSRSAESFQIEGSSNS